ncbi:MAG: class I SAM-dependent methyltransferase [Acidobacteria bacterium]|nr:class I SAM-dependent methyltransferase [Acidobacteriota bacterium]
MSEAPIKKRIASHWTRYVPGWDVPTAPLESREFFGQVDTRWLKFEHYLPGIIAEVAGPGKKVLEVGCGLGSASREFARQGSQVVSMDLSFSNVQKTRLGYKASGLRGYCVNGDAEKLPFKEGAFDVVYSYGVLHHTPDTAGAIQELYRVLARGGKSVVMLYKKGASYAYVRLMGLVTRDSSRMSREELISKRYDQTPLSKMYSKAEVRALFRDFDDIRLQVIQYGGVRENPKLVLYYKLITLFPFIENWLGSFLIIKCSKKSGRMRAGE